MTTMLYSPFFRQGRLCLPKATLQLLVESGLDTELAKQAHRGLHLDDDREIITIINQQLESILDTLDPAIQAQFTSQDVVFMLSNTLEQDDLARA